MIPALVRQIPAPVLKTLRVVVIPAVLALLVSFAWTLDEYANRTLSQILVVGLLAVSVALLTGIAGLPTLGQTAPYLVGAYTAATLVEHDIDSGIVQLLAAGGAGALFALITAPLVVYARGVVVLMITLALGELVQTLAGRWKSVTHGTDGMTALAHVTPLPGLAPLETDEATYLYVLAPCCGPPAMTRRGCGPAATRSPDTSPSPTWPRVRWPASPVRCW